MNVTAKIKHLIRIIRCYIAPKDVIINSARWDIAVKEHILPKYIKLWGDHNIKSKPETVSVEEYIDCILRTGDTDELYRTYYPEFNADKNNPSFDYAKCPKISG